LKGLAEIDESVLIDAIRERASRRRVKEDGGVKWAAKKAERKAINFEEVVRRKGKRTIRKKRGSDECHSNGEKVKGGEGA